MFKRLLLSVMLVAGSVCASEEVVEAVSKFTPEVQSFLDSLRAAVEAAPDSAAAAIAYKAGAEQIRALVGRENIELAKIADQYDSCGQLMEFFADFAKDAEESALYWAGVRSFAWNMFNPFAYIAAAKETLGSVNKILFEPY